MEHNFGESHLHACKASIKINRNVPEQHRYNMSALAIDGNEGFEVSDMELSDLKFLIQYTPWKRFRINWARNANCTSFAVRMHF